MEFAAELFTEITGDLLLSFIATIIRWIFLNLKRVTVHIVKAFCKI